MGVSLLIIPYPPPMPNQVENTRLKKSIQVGPVDVGTRSASGGGGCKNKWELLPLHWV
ncbi:uncharacterized protein METZ01_LOCUS163217 [marine metagenome]|uniref:Uncharacterized protein n=1 Tax=marine metagenome TaxID=408172 RepID=A0A382BAV6_9ZZZZ